MRFLYDERSLLRESYRPYIIQHIILFIVLVTFTRIFMNEENVIEITGLLLDHYQTIGTKESSSLQNLVSLFANNLRVALLAFVLGYIPIFIFPYLIVGFNACLISIYLTYQVEVQGYALLKVIASILPHGITEISSFIIAGALGSFVSINLFRKIINQKTTMSLISMTQTTLKSFLIIVIPLLAISAIIEVYLSPIVSKLLLA